MIGKYYYYIGNSVKANFYHLKNVNGIFEPENSITRKIAIKKLSIFFASKFQIKQHKNIIQNNYNDEEMSSDDESFDYLFQNNDYEQQYIFLEKKQNL